MALGWPVITEMSEEQAAADLALYPAWSRVTHVPTDHGLLPLDVRRALYQTEYFYEKNRIDHPEAPKQRRGKRKVA